MKNCCSESADERKQKEIDVSNVAGGEIGEASGEAPSQTGGINSKRVYIRRKKKSRTHNIRRPGFMFVHGSKLVQGTKLVHGTFSTRFPGEDTATQLPSTDAQAAETHQSSGEETKTLNQQQIDPNQPNLHSSHGMEASMVVENASSTWTKIQISEGRRKIQSTPTSEIQISGEKTNIQSAPTSGDLGRIGRDDSELCKIVHVMGHEQEKHLEGLDWNYAKFQKEIRFYSRHLNLGPPDDSDDDDKFWDEYEEPELTQLKERLALHRILAHEISEEKQPLDDAELRKRYPPSLLKEEGYFEKHEWNLEWHFYPEYCKYVGFQDYQRLVLRNKHEYHDWEHYRKTNSTYEADREFVKFYEKLASGTKWIDECLTDRKLEWGRIECMAFYQAVKIAAGFDNIYRDLVYSCFQEFMWSVWFDYYRYKACARLYLEIWKRVAKQKMDFVDALKQIHEQDTRPSFSFEIKCELKRSPKSKLECEIERSLKSGSMKYNYDTYIAHIEEEVQEDKALLVIMENIGTLVPPKLKTYYDYVKKKLQVVEEIRLIPPES